MSKQPDILDLLRKRTSVRAIDAAPVDDPHIHAVLEAARWAPSWGNLQPWRFVVVREAGTRAAVAAAFTRGNAWAARAPVLIAVTSNPSDAKQRDGESSYLFDCGLAVHSMLVEAAHCGLIAHPFGGWDEATIQRAIATPPGTRIVVMIAVGWPGDLAELDERTREKELRRRERKPLAELAYADRWGQSLPFTTAGDHAES